MLRSSQEKEKFRYLTVLLEIFNDFSQFGFSISTQGSIELLHKLPSFIKEINSLPSFMQVLQPTSQSCTGLGNGSFQEHT